VLAALSACASITAQMYAERRQWPLRGVHVEVSYSRVLAENQKGAATRVGIVDRIDMGISCAGDLTNEQQERLFAVAHSHGCAVHRMLITQVEIHPRAVNGSVFLRVRGEMGNADSSGTPCARSAPLTFPLPPRRAFGFAGILSGRSIREHAGFHG
jgi:uncharacterized OsmC-like protein